MQATSLHDGGGILRGGGGSGGSSSTHPAFHTDPTAPHHLQKQEHFYSEIPPPPPAPPPPMELQPEPFHIQDLKGLDYNTKGQSMGPLASHTNKQQSYGTTFNTSGSTARGTLSTSLSKPMTAQSKMDDLDFDLYARMRSPICICTRQVTIHVVIMILAGLVYLGAGGVAGFYLGKYCEYLILVSFLERKRERKRDRQTDRERERKRERGELVCGVRISVCGLRVWKFVVLCLRACVSPVHLNVDRRLFLGLNTKR